MQSRSRKLLLALAVIAVMFIRHVSVYSLTPEQRQNECVQTYMAEHRGEGSDLVLINNAIRSDDCAFRETLIFSLMRVRAEKFDATGIVGDVLLLGFLILTMRHEVKDNQKS
ncbi:MAG: hypothetical protein UY72_C0055G0006 [Candidatus Uhrbacteria bacterium GW2011_GWD2_52_7]|uniref:Uncharacterized protein n=1 Tax=Candidatus Uhrbacteria bacterium GW2011_GWD2_52_7 TaxID=1618989 RepID=A0A0G2A9M8_9BACT|nr:MAG: hypothetical protein UY72_C0055G0006 [Candidatus Uhrbacteria bacterium GW2011_GWD2_52_7]